ncbi:hypothetical protein HHUSO_G29588 [Huso huso]|uniref:Ig-like domain-containing protein n=1 Tax=Huso huso TaxID=61971 RepID=A0ABR0YFV2_HUSHU
MLLRLILLFYTLQVGDAGLFQYPPLVRVEVGSSVNLTCDIEDMSGKCFGVIWFKLRSQASRPGNLSKSMYTGNGSTLVVRESDGEVQSSGAATLVCLVFGVSEQARVYWLIDHGLTVSGSGDSSESTPDFIRNQITIPGEVWSSGSVCTERCVSLFLYGSLAAASFLLITLLITLVICYRRQNKPDAYLANEPSMYSEIRVTGRAPDKHIAGQRENTGSGGRHARPKIRAAQVRDDVQYASLQFEARGRQK